MAIGALPLIEQIALGTAWGAGGFFVNTTAFTICRVAGVKFETFKTEFTDSVESDLLTNFTVVVVIAPFLEECFFRAFLQPFLSDGLLFYMPQLATTAFWGIPIASVVAAVAIGILFGVLHYFDYKSGGIYAVLFLSVYGSFFGILKECFGLATPIVAHMINNFGCFMIQKRYGEFLDSCLEPEPPEGGLCCQGGDLGQGLDSIP